jgi:SAM-dependent methyltransferase
VTVTLAPTACAICGAGTPSAELYPANLSGADFNTEVFSQRRLPDRIHYRMVRCRRCGLVRADPAADARVLEELYERSEGFDAEEANLRRTYGRYLRRLGRHGVPGDRLLEIGSGTGFFLQQAQVDGYGIVTGIEPSRAAAALADPSIANRIVQGPMKPGLFESDAFDVVCLFQVFDHIPDPNLLLRECRRVLRPGGLILALNHNVDALPNRVLGARSPIIDVEHTYLYSPATMSAIFRTNSFDVLEVGRVWNDYSLSYLARLAPIPRRPKALLLRALSSWIGRVTLRAALGNLYLIARNPIPQREPS